MSKERFLAPGEDFTNKRNTARAQVLQWIESKLYRVRQQKFSTQVKKKKNQNDLAERYKLG